MIVFQSSVMKVHKKRQRYIGVARIFDWGTEAKPQITRNDIIKIFRKKGLFTKQRYRRMEDQKPGAGFKAYERGGRMGKTHRKAHRKQNRYNFGEDPFF